MLYAWCDAGRVMNAFTIQIRGATRVEEMSNVTSFVGEDASGSFGILPNHARLMTSLVTGLARFRIDEEAWQYLAVPGALLYFRDNVLMLSTRSYLLDDDYMRISQALREQLLAEEDKLRSMKESLHQMEEEVFKRLWEMDRRGAG